MRELLLIDPAPAGDWTDKALCAQTDPEAFFPEKGGSTREAKRVCLTCEVRDECLQAALDRDERFGIWGGLSERERRKLKHANTHAPTHDASRGTDPGADPSTDPAGVSPAASDDGTAA